MAICRAPLPVIGCLCKLYCPSKGEIMSSAEDQITTSFDREKWEIERGFRERELAVKEGELQLRRKEQSGSSWRNPLVVAILAAAAAAAGNAVVAVVNG